MVDAGLGFGAIRLGFFPRRHRLLVYHDKTACSGLVSSCSKRLAALVIFFFLFVCLSPACVPSFISRRRHCTLKIEQLMKVIEDSDDIGWHWDKDYGMEAQGINVHPCLATVTYLSTNGGPTVILEKTVRASLSSH